MSAAETAFLPILYTAKISTLTFGAGIIIFFLILAHPVYKM